MIMFGINILLWTYVPNVMIQSTCINPNVLRGTYIGQKLDGNIVQRFHSDGLMLCARECIFHANCMSFNFHTNLGNCELIRETTDWNNPLISAPSFLYANKSDLSWEIAESCQFVHCPANHKCFQGQGTNDAQCVFVDCGPPPNIKFGSIPRYDGTIIGYNASYTCSGDEVLYQEIMLTCSTNGTWDGEGCRNVATCKDIQICNSNLTDGEYWLYPLVFGNTQRVKIYCHGLNTSTPTEFVTLVNENRVIGPMLKIANYATCTITSAGHAKLGDSIFNKIQITIDDMLINKTNVQFAELMHGNHQQYGQTFDCLSYEDLCLNIPSGRLTIDTTDTGLIIDRNTVWVTYGHGSYMRYFNRLSDQVIEVSGNGKCGGCRPVPPLTLELDPTAHLTDNQATKVVCLP